MNEQAAAVAAIVLSQHVEAATRCEQASTTATQIYPSGGGEVFSKRVPNGAGLPKSFVIAITRSHLYALEDKQHRHNLVPGRVLKSWDRAGFRANTGSAAMSMASGAPEDRQILTLWRPIDSDGSPIAQAIVQQRAAAGGRIPGQPHTSSLPRTPQASESSPRSRRNRSARRAEARNSTSAAARTSGSAPERTSRSAVDASRT